MKYKALMLGVGLALVAGVAFLFGQVSDPSSSSLQPKASEPTTSGRTSVATVGHQIDDARVNPSTIISGNHTLIIFSATIADPDVLPTSVNLLSVGPAGTLTPIGLMHDDGLNGDAVAGDQIYSLRMSQVSFQPGAQQFRVSAAFKNTVRRVLSPTITLQIEAPLDKSTWTPIPDPERAFSIRAPSEWNLRPVNLPGVSSPSVRTVDFRFPDGTSAFRITILTPIAWANYESNAVDVPVLVSDSGSMVFVAFPPQDDVREAIVSDSDLRKLLPQILSTFTIH